jgi:hypothetical protein
VYGVRMINADCVVVYKKEDWERSQMSYQVKAQVYDQVWWHRVSIQVLDKVWNQVWHD